MNETYVTDLTHFLDEAGEIRADIPREARELASFLALIVDAVAAQFTRTDCGVETRFSRKGGIACEDSGRRMTSALQHHLS